MTLQVEHNVHLVHILWQVCGPFVLEAVPADLAMSKPSMSLIEIDKQRYFAEKPMKLQMPHHPANVCRMCDF